MSAVTGFLRNPLVTWVNTFRSNSPAETINDFADGVLLNEVMVEIDPTYFTLTRVHQNVDGDTNIRIQNLDILVRHLKAFYQEKLQQLILMKAPNVVLIAHSPDSDDGLDELSKVILLMLGCAVQCENKENFIAKITELDLETQKHLVEYIKEITENHSHVLTFRRSELQGASEEHILDVVESMFYQISGIVEDRDNAYGLITHLSVERETLLQESQRSRSPRPFSPPLSSIHLLVDSPSVMATKEKIRNLSEEMEEKNAAIAELKEELLLSKRMLEKVRHENKELSQDAVYVKTCRDQMDVLKSKADRVEKLETDSVKYKEKLRDLEYLKKRAEELKEENEILYDNRQLLQEQLAGLSNKEERIEILEEETTKLKSHIHHLAEERQYDQDKIKEVMANNAQLNLEKQESMAELFSLSAEIEVLRGKSPLGSVNLASECKESSSMDVLRLSHENQHLKKSLEGLRGSSAKLIELERDNRSLHGKRLNEKASMHKLTEEVAKLKAKLKEKTSEVDNLTRTIHAMQDDIHMTSSEVLNLSGELKQKGEAIAQLEQENYSRANEIEDKSKDVEAREESVASLTERVTMKQKELVVLDSKSKEKDLVISDMKKRVQEKKVAVEELSESLTGKDKQLRSLQSRLDESIDDQQKSDEMIRKQKKDITELENRSPTQDVAPNSTVSVPRIPVNAERDFRDLKKEKSKYYKHECHQLNLKKYREKGMIPEGLKLNTTPYVSDVTDKLVSRWEVILRSASEMLLDLLISHHEEALCITWKNIRDMEKSIQMKYGEDLATRILQLGNEIARKDKEKLQEKAQSKLVKRSVDRKEIGLVFKSDSSTENRYNSARGTQGRRERSSDGQREGFRDRQQFGGSARRRNNQARSYVGMGRGRKPIL